MMLALYYQSANPAAQQTVAPTQGLPTWHHQADVHSSVTRDNVRSLVSQSTAVSSDKWPLTHCNCHHRGLRNGSDKGVKQTEALRNCYSMLCSHRYSFYFIARKKKTSEEDRINAKPKYEQIKRRYQKEQKLLRRFSFPIEETNRGKVNHVIKMPLTYCSCKKNANKEWPNLAPELSQWPISLRKSFGFHKEKFIEKLLLLKNVQKLVEKYKISNSSGAERAAPVRQSVQPGSPPSALE